MDLKVNEIVFREDLYPRLAKVPTLVQQYTECLEVLPPIEVNQRNELIDGWHRWTAHKKADKESIAVIVTHTQSDIHLLELAIERNSAYGLQLNQEEKRDIARRIYNITPEREREGKKKHLAKILSVTERAVRDWLSRIDKDTKEARNKRIFGLWLACHTQEEIAEREGIHHSTVQEVLREMAELPKSAKAAADHLTDFKPPIFNIWKQQEKSPGSSIFGNSEVRWLDNLLYLYTKPFDIVIDPFAGGGSTIDLCCKRFRRYWVSDRKPVIEREEEIRQWDIVDGLPRLPRWQDVSLVYLDPPYWKQSEKKYSDSPNDLANMSLEDFNKTLSGLVNAFGNKLPPSAHIALLIQPTQWNAPNRETVDHVADMLRLVRLPLKMRYSCPYESQQATAQMAEWAKENKKCLVLTREIIVWRK
jgi:hypothetical protein